MIELIKQKQTSVDNICRKLKVAELYLFGSAVSGQFNASSDLDFAVIFSSELSPLEHGEAFFELKEELDNIFNRPIDLVSYRVVKNPIFKQELDRTKVSLYAA